MDEAARAIIAMNEEIQSLRADIDNLKSKANEPVKAVPKSTPKPRAKKAPVK
jgi:hypothetical protein